MTDYTAEELREFLDGISLSLLSLRSAQYWKYDEKVADRIMWLESLYKKVKYDIKSKEGEGRNELR